MHATAWRIDSAIYQGEHTICRIYSKAGYLGSKRTWKIYRGIKLGLASHGKSPNSVNSLNTLTGCYQPLVLTATHR
ncbi:hypothetical protein Aph02nite_10240 [Actinoplanes philippinensis]|nr:hypothetical protein Aph02nite_10240 [Actinoplanes philippinensis]